MPFKSSQQRKACYATHGFGGKIDCDEWNSVTPKNIPKRVKKYQIGGQDSTADFNNIADAFIQQQQPQEEYTPQPEEAASQEDNPSNYDDLQSQIEELKSQLEEYKTTKYDPTFDEAPQDETTDFMFNNPSDNEPIIFGDSPFAAGSDVSYSGSTSSVASQIARRESGGNYTAFTPAGGGAGAVGKYQFRWNLHKDDIANVTGISNREEFRHNPEAQERYFQHWEQTVLRPEAEKIQQYVPNVPLEQIEKQIHFAGPAGARNYFLHGKVTRDAFGTTNATYQTGGGDMNEGLNNPNLNEMVFPLSGTNTFRGLDSEEPVLLHDQFGKQIVLRGPKHTTRMRGRVYELKI